MRDILTVMSEASPIYERLLYAYEHDAVAHAYLFTGERGSGKRETARHVASHILGIDDTNLKAHPDFMALERSYDNDAPRDITIDEVREFKKRLLLTAALGGWKVAILEGAELLSKEAASALLKILEAPAGQTVIMLIAERYGAVLPTIRSRAVRISFPPPKLELQTTFDAESNGEMSEFKKLFEEISEMPYALRFKASERYAKSAGDRDLLMRYTALRFHDELAVVSHASASPAGCIARIKSLIRTDALLTHTNTNPRLLLDVFLLSL